MERIHHVSAWTEPPPTPSLALFQSSGHDRDVENHNTMAQIDKLVRSLVHNKIIEQLMVKPVEHAILAQPNVLKAAGIEVLPGGK